MILVCGCTFTIDGISHTLIFFTQTPLSLYFLYLGINSYLAHIHVAFNKNDYSVIYVLILN